MNKVWLGANKVYAPRTVLSQEDLLIQAAPKLVKRCENAAHLHEVRESFGQCLIDDSIYSYSEFYSSVFIFDRDQLTSHMERNAGKVHGFGREEDTIINADWYVADFDDPQGIKGIILNVSKILMYLELNNIPYYLFASGMKGLHLYIPINVFNFDPKYKDKMHIVFGSITDWLEREFKLPAGFIDRIYDPLRMIRYPFSLHPKSGLIKTLAIFFAKKFKPHEDISSYLSIEPGITTDSANIIKEKILRPYDGPIDFHIDITVEEKPVYENSETDVDNKLFVSPLSERYCIYSMFNATNIEGQRRRVALVLIFWLKEKGLPEELAFKVMKFWSARLVKPLTNEELVDVMKYYGRYTRSCSDPTMKAYCPQSKICKYWKYDLLQKRVADFSTSLEQTRELARETPVTRIYFDEFLKDFPAYLSTKFGHILCVGAASGVGKTWLVLNMIAMIKRMNFLVFSYEQSKYELLLRLASLYGLDINDPEQSDILLESLSHIYIDDTGATTLKEQIEVKRAIEQEKGIKIHCIVIDYIQLVRVEDHNNPNRFVSDATAAMVEVSKTIKTLAKQEEVAYICLSQVPKDRSGNGNTMLTEEDLKDSQSLNNMLTSKLYNSFRISNIEEHTVVILYENPLNCWKLLPLKGEDNQQPSSIFEKVQRLFRKEVHLSEWKRWVPY